MRTWIYLLILFFTLTSFISRNSKNAETTAKAIYLQKDKEILNQILQLYSTEKKTKIGELMIKVGLFFKETPYVPNTLEKEPEQLIINLRELDCTTFAENSLAIARTIKSENPSFEQFTKELQYIRYHNGKINGYPSRIHYFSDWIFENDKKELVKDISKEIANTPFPVHLNFMSTHPQSYVQLKNDSTLIPVFAAKEQEISKREMYFIPEEKVAAFENLLQNGDIAGITTSIEGLDMSHVVILQRVNGRIHILHASTTAKQVILSEETLEEYLKKNKSATGIMVARPL